MMVDGVSVYPQQLARSSISSVSSMASKLRSATPAVCWRSSSTLLEIGPGRGP